MAFCPRGVPLGVVSAALTSTSPAAMAVTCSGTFARAFAPILSGPGCGSIRSRGWAGVMVRRTSWIGTARSLTTVTCMTPRSAKKFTEPLGDTRTLLLTVLIADLVAASMAVRPPGWLRQRTDSSCVWASVHVDAKRCPSPRMLSMPEMVDSVSGIVASWSEVNGEMPGLSRSAAVGVAAVEVGEDVVIPLVPVAPWLGTGATSLAASSCSVVVGISHGALATAANRDRRTAGSPANVLGSATSTDRLGVPGRSPSSAMESARNRWMVMAPVAFDEVWATVLLRDSSYASSGSPLVDLLLALGVGPLGLLSVDAEVTEAVSPGAANALRNRAWVRGVSVPATGHAMAARAGPMATSSDEGWLTRAVRARWPDVTGSRAARSGSA